MRLEYRLDDEAKQYPALWNYPDTSIAETVARMTCEYFIKEGDTYVVTATAMDPDGTAVLYIKKETLFDDSSPTTYSHIGFEIRELQGTNSILIESNEVWNHEEVLTYLHSDILYVQRNEILMEFALDSREIDEDRKCYVYYGEFTGECR